MSHRENDRVFPITKTQDLDKQLAAAVSQVLRQHFTEISSAIKVFGRMTGAHPRAIRNWYEGRNVPSSSHLILLAHHIPAIAEVLLTLAGRKNIWIAYQMVVEHSSVLGALPPDEALKSFLSDTFVSINVNVSPPTIAERLNQRQLWFLGNLQHGVTVKANDITNLWNVDIRTSLRDIAGLTKMGLICFVGAKKTGKYVVATESYLL